MVMIKAFRTKTKTIYAEDFCKFEQHDNITFCDLIFKDKIITIVGDFDTESWDELQEYLKSESNEIYDLASSFEIFEFFNHDNIVYDINKLKNLNIAPSEIMLSFGGALVLHHVSKKCKDINMFITPEASYRIEDEYGIKRTEAPIGNTSKQTVYNIDLFAYDGTVHIAEKFHPLLIILLKSKL